MTLIAGGRVVTANRLVESGWVSVEGEVITATGIGEVDGPVDVDLRGRVLIPGFVDQHCHGGGGASFVTDDPAEAFRAAASHQRHGTTSIIASLVSGSNSDLKAWISTLAPLADQGVIEGIHLEGPWISQLHCGAHMMSELRPPTQREVGELLALGGGRIKMITLAPELPGGLLAIRQITGAGAIAAIGHTDADYDLTREAIDLGATVATHLSNAMRSLQHRDPGALGALLQDERVTLELIADGVHVHPMFLRLVAHESRADRVAFITDAMAAAGAPDGQYRLGKLDVNVVNGTARRVDSGAIAGSTLTLDEALRFTVLECGMPLDQVARSLSAVPARTMGLTDRGVIEPGKRADLLILGSRLEVDAVMVRGDWVHNQPAS